LGDFGGIASGNSSLDELNSIETKEHCCGYTDAEERECHSG